MFNPSFLSNKNTLSRNTQCIFIHSTLCLAANCIAFCTKTHCVLHQIALRFAPYCTAFSTKTHCVLVHIAVHFGAYCSAFWCILQCVLVLNAVQFAPNSTTFAANCPPSCIIIAFMQCLSSFHHLQTNPIFHQNKPPRESIICGRVDDWLIKTVLIMLNVELKTLHRFVLIWLHL